MSVGDRIDWIRDSAPLRALNRIAVVLLILGAAIVALSLFFLSNTQESAGLGAAIVGLYLGVAAFGIGVSTGFLALAVSAIVGAIARASLDRGLGAGSKDNPRTWLDEHGD